MKNYDQFWYQELIIDFIALIDMILYFFTAYEEDEADDRYCKNLGHIMTNYLTTYFIVDFMAVVPILTMSLIAYGPWGLSAWQL